MKAGLQRAKDLIIITAVCSVAFTTGCSSKPGLWHDATHYPHGYLHTDQVSFVRAAALLSPAPLPGSQQDEIDREMVLKTRVQATPARKNIAARDAILGPPTAPAAFECALGISLDPPKAPHLTRLLARALPDVETVQKSIKIEGSFRLRPYVAMQFSPCVDGSALAKTSSYPSGHAAIGWAWALILAEMAPDRAETILHRGITYGNSRIVCGFHYPGDVQAGQLLGAALVSLWHASHQFQKEYVLARKELNILRKKYSDPDYCKVDIKNLYNERNNMDNQSILN